MNSRKSLAAFYSLATLLVVSLVGNAGANQQVAQTPILGKSIPKYVDPVPVFGSAALPRVGGTSISVNMEEFQQKVLPDSFYTGLTAPYNAGTYVWSYQVGTAPAHYPGVTIEAQRNAPTTVTYTNNLAGAGGSATFLQKYLTVDQTIHWADPLVLDCLMNPSQPACFTPYGNPNWVGPGNPPAAQIPGAPVPTVVHLHGGEDPSAFDGGPDQWFTPNGIHGPGYVSLSPVAGNQDIYRYPNGQQATTLWFHDHALGTTRVNVFSGLAAFYLLRDSRDTGLPGNAINLPGGEREIELLIQDRQFDSNGQLFFPDGPLGGLNGPPPNPTVHPFWIPEFFGDVIVVNGKSWPYLNVEPKRYRFRLVNGSNARMYNFSFSNNMPFWQIGTDGGLLDTPVKASSIFLAPAERADVIVDFSGQKVGANIILTNSAKAPFPSGAPADPQTVGQIMQFRMVALTSPDTTCNPALAAGSAGACDLRGTDPIVRLANPTTGSLAPGVVPDKKRQLVLKEIEGPGGPLEVLLNNTKWLGLKESTLTSGNPQPLPGSTQIGPEWFTELPRVGSTEVWEIANITGDAHPIHIHLIQFQLINRQTFQLNKYTSAWEAAFAGGFKPGDGPPFSYNTVNADNAVGGNIPFTPYLQMSPAPPAANEAGWKDTIVMHPGEITRVAVRFAPQGVAVGGVSAGINLFPFDPTALIGQTDFAGNPGGPGYVWHCHILDHEDNEMMRPYIPVP